jgi:hypothetical protein
MLVRFGLQESSLALLDNTFRNELTLFTRDACCRLPKRNVTSDNFIASVFAITILAGKYVRTSSV